MLAIFQGGATACAKALRGVGRNGILEERGEVSMSGTWVCGKK